MRRFQFPYLLVCLMGAASLSYSQTAVYYSVGTAGSDLKSSGALTVDIASGTATFSEPQANNIGVGDEVTYNTSNKVYISRRFSSTVYSVTTATGGTPANVTGATVDSIQRAFNSLVVAEANSSDGSHLNTLNLVAGNYQLNWACYNDGPMGDNIIAIDGYTTGPNNYIGIFAPTSADQVGSSQRHTGVAGTGFRLVPSFDLTATLDFWYVQILDEYVRIEGIEIDGSSLSNGRRLTAVRVDVPVPSDVRLDKLLVHDFINSNVNPADDNDVFGFQIKNGNVKISNSIIYRLEQLSTNALASVQAIYATGADTSYVFNNTIYNIKHSSGNGTSASGIKILAGTVTATNNAVFDVDCTSGPEACFDGSMTQDYNVSSDLTATGPNSQTGQTSYASYFLSITGGSENLHLRNDSRTLWGIYGADLDSDPNLPVSKDIDGQWRDPDRPDIGADEFSCTCTALATSEGGGKITITSPGSFETVFNRAQGASLEEYYDLVEDPGRANNLTGRPTSNFYGLFHDSIVSSTILYTSGTNTNGAELQLLEATATRVRVRQENFFQRVPAATTILPGLKAYGDYSIYPSGRIGLRWNRKTTASVPQEGHPLEFSARVEAVPDPRNDLTLYNEAGTTFPRVPGTDDFVLLKRNMPGASADFLGILHRDWPLATQLDAAPSVAYTSWRDLNAGSLAAGLDEFWNLLVYHKPNNFADHADPAVTERRDDFRNADPITVIGPGSGWNENTSDADFFNESEGAYTFDFDMSLGLTFEMDGATTNRFSPFFKIRGWRSLHEPSVTLQSVGLTNDVDFRADVKPLSRAFFAQDLMWSSTLHNAAAVTGPEVGTAGTVNGSDFQPSPYGNGARFDLDGEYLTLPASGNVDPNRGSIEFWYQPNYVYGSGASSDDHGFFGYYIDANNYFYGLHQPYLGGTGVGEGIYFRVNAGGVLSEVVLGAGPSFPVLWRAGDWVHLRFVWDVGASRLEVYVNEKLTGSAAYNAAPALPGDNIFYIGERNHGGTQNNNAEGIIDEFRIYSNPDAPEPIGYAGLSGSSSEFFANTASNFTLDFNTVDGSGRGEYAYFGSDSKFRGLNISLGTLGVGPIDLQWQYWNGTAGAWSDLEQVPFGFTDETNDLTRSGTIYWTSDPTSWSTYSISGGPDLFYVRAYLASGSYAPAPVERLIKTDILLFQYCGHITADDQEFSFAVPITTEVELESLAAVGRDGAVEVRWTTASEIDNLGFHLYRSTAENGPYQRITSYPIPGLGSSPVGASYRYLDEDLANGTTYYYELEDIETTGKTERHGPVSATPHEKTVSVPEPQVTTPPPSSEEPSSGDLITYGNVSGNSLRITKPDRYQVVLELRTEGFHAIPQGDGTVQLSVPDFVDMSEEGSLSLPVKRHWIEAIAGRKVNLVSVRAEGVEAVNLRPADVGVPEVTASYDGTVRLVRGRSRVSRRWTRTGTAGDERELLPETAARLVSVGFQGETKKALVEMAPLRWDPAMGQTLLTRRLVVHLSFREPEPDEVSRGGRRGRRYRSREGQARQLVVARLATTTPGLYAVGFEDVFSPIGGGVDAGSLRLSRLGESVAFHVEPDPNRFESGSVLYFLSEGAAANIYGGEAVYELEYGAAGESMPRQAAPPSGHSTGFYWKRLEQEQNLFYQAALLEAPDIWLWDMLFSPSRKSYRFTISALTSISQKAKLEVWLQGGSDFAASPDHHVRLKLNQVLVDEVSWDGRKPQKVEVEILPGVLQEGDNFLEIENVHDTEATYSMVFLDRFALTYPRSTMVESGSLEGLWTEAGTSEVTGLTGAAHVLDVTDAMPRWLTNVETGLEGAVRFRTEAGRRYYVTDTVRRAEIRKAAPIRWKNTSHRADYLVIGPRAFLDDAEPLIRHRKAQGLKVKAVPVEDVFAEFGFGETRPDAIRAFVAYAYHNWREPSLRYVLLLGDATYDFKNHQETGVQNHIPPLIIKTSYLWTVSDPAYAAVNGEDLLPDVSIGRLPAADEDELRVMVDKILTYETGSANQQAPVVLVTDDADLGGNFDGNAAELASTVLATRSPHLIQLSQLGSAATRAEILDTFNRGVSLVSYIGHGGIHLWASENIFNIDQVSFLSGQSQQPLLLTMNCLNGYFHFPYFNSLAEELLKADGKGAIAAFSPSGLGLNASAHQLHLALLQALVSGGHERLGDVILEAQERYATGGNSPELLSIYHLLGDPALRLK